MAEAPIPFHEQIAANKAAAEVSTEVASLETDSSALAVRLRGCYLINCELTSPNTGARVQVLHSAEDIKPPKITASHVMMPAGPNDEGIGGQHGYPRWADYQVTSHDDGPNGVKRAAFVAQRTDDGLALTKSVALSGSSLHSSTIVTNTSGVEEATSIGEHYYFTLAHEQFDGLKIEGRTIDELLGDGSEEILKNDGTLFWDFGGSAQIDFPAGHSIRLSAEFDDGAGQPVAMWIWHRRDTPSICFEPLVGVDAESRSDGVKIAPGAQTTLNTTIELL